MVKKIAIIGGGINGFCCAVQLQEKYKNYEVTVISEEFSPNTTGDGSAGLWGPYLMGSTPDNKVFEWSKDMHDFLKEIWLSDEAGEAGVCLIPCFRMTLEDGNIWEKIVYGCRKLSLKELDLLNEGKEHKFTRGHHFITYTSEPRKLLPYLTKKFVDRGGKIMSRKITNLKEFSNNSCYDVIINCTGLGSKEMVGDLSMHSIRGQVARVQAGWMYYVFLDEADEGNYVIPNTESVVLGGTHQVNDFNVSLSKEDSDFIFSGCKKLVPGLKHVPVLRQWVGLRPGRPSVRLEPEILGNGKILIHNYGHGGSGVTVSWGCAKDVVKILQSQQSKL